MRNSMRGMANRVAADLALHAAVSAVEVLRAIWPWFPHTSEKVSDGSHASASVQCE